MDDDNINEDKFEDENEETIRSSIYESIEKSAKFNPIVEKKKTTIEKQENNKNNEKIENTKIQKKTTISPSKKQSVTPKVTKSEKSEGKISKESKQSNKAPEGCFKEFKIGDADSKLGNEGFSEDPSINLWTPTSEERQILKNFETPKQKNYLKIKQSVH